MVADYLTAERDLGRIAADADVDTLAPTLIGAAHLLFADRTGLPPEPEAVRRMVSTVIGSVVQEPRDELGAESLTGHLTAGVPGRARRKTA